MFCVAKCIEGRDERLLNISDDSYSEKCYRTKTNYINPLVSSDFEQSEKLYREIRVEQKKQMNKLKKTLHASLITLCTCNACTCNATALAQDATTDTFVYHAEIIESRLSAVTQKKAKTKYFWLNALSSDVFNTKKLRTPKKIRESLVNPRGYAGQIITIPRPDGTNIRCTYFDKGQNNLVVIGTGFGNEREKVAPLIPLVMEHNDVVIFDHLGHGYDEKTSTFKTKFLEFLLRHKFPAINCNKTTLGNKEDQDVAKLISYFKNQKQYNNVYGIGFCFSGLVFTKAESIARQNGGKLFDKLVLDGCLLSPQNAINQVIKDPMLIFSPQKGGWSNKKLVKAKWFNNYLRNKFTSLFKNAGKIDHLNTANYISELKETPLLFFHSKIDLMVPYKDFQKIWKSTATSQKTAIITKNSHLTNHIKDKQVYAYIINEFFKNSYDEFKKVVR